MKETPVYLLRLDDRDGITYVASSLEELFSERKQREDEISRVEDAITQQKRSNQMAIQSMDPSIKDRYEALKEQSEALRELVAERQQELSDLQNLKNQMETDLLNSPLKQKAANLRERLIELAAKERELMEEKANEESLDQKKAKLIESVRRNNEEIAAMEKQLSAMNEQIENAQEELHEFNTDMDSGNKEHVERYRSLVAKEAEMSDVLDNFEEKKRMLGMEMEEFQEAIVGNLRRISLNMNKVNIADQITDMDASALEMDDSASPEELKALHVRLEEELITMGEMETRIRGELEAFDRRSEGMEEELAAMSSYQQLAEEAQRDNEELEGRRASLLAAVPSLEAALTDTEAELDAITDELHRDDRIAIVESMQKQLSYLQETNGQMRAQAEQRENEGNFEGIKIKALELQAAYNQLLIANAGKR